MVALPESPAEIVDTDPGGIFFLISPQAKSRYLVQSAALSASMLAINPPHPPRFVRSGDPVMALNLR
jgi:hypothetical protein